MVPDFTIEQAAKLKIDPCCVCKSFERAEGNYWKPICSKHEPIWTICFSGVADGTMAAKNADLSTLDMAYNYLVSSGRSSTLLKNIVREIKKRLKKHKP